MHQGVFWISLLRLFCSRLWQTWTNSPRIKLFDLNYLSNNEENLYTFCRNETTRTSFCFATTKDVTLGMQPFLYCFISFFNLSWISATEIRQEQFWNRRFTIRLYLIYKTRLLRRLTLILVLWDQWKWQWLKLKKM